MKPIKILTVFFLVFILASCTDFSKFPNGPTRSPDGSPVETGAVDSQTIDRAASETQAALMSASSDQLAALLPAGASFDLNLSWKADSPCGVWQALPYRMPDKTLSLSVINTNTQSAGNSSLQTLWDWRWETLSAQYAWQDLRPLTKTPSSSTFAFLAQDSSQAWWAGLVLDICHSPYLSVLLPIANPVNVRVGYRWEETGTGQFWSVDGGALKMYRWDGKLATRLWSVDGAPHDAARIFITDGPDITQDEKPEILLYWYTSDTADGWRSQANVSAIWFLQPVATGYQLVASVSPHFEFMDVDNDGQGEFLQPDRPESPQSWSILDWNGVQFIPKGKLTSPQAPAAQNPDPARLPPLPYDLYFYQAQSVWIWPKAGGALQAITQVPSTPAPSICLYKKDDHFGPEQWSPDCHFQVIYQAGLVNGGSLAVKNLATNDIIDIPNSSSALRGFSTFAWDPYSRFLLHARADGNEGLFEIDLPEGTLKPRLSLFNVFDPSNSWGVLDPTVLLDGSIGLSVQGSNTNLYPPLGVYRLYRSGELRRLADIPPLAEPQGSDPRPLYGQVTWSPEGAMFLYVASTQRRHGYLEPPYSAILLGKSDGSAVWDLKPLLGGAQGFWWGK